MVMYPAFNRFDVGSIPTASRFAVIAQLVEQSPCKRSVAGSIPADGSMHT